MDKLLRIQLLGGFTAQRVGRKVRKYQTRKAGAMLAYLAYFLPDKHSRDELTERIWPESDAIAAGKCMRTALCTLRAELEKGDDDRSALFVGGHGLLGINPETTTTDVIEFLSHIDAARGEASVDRRIELLTRAAELYRGEFLPGFYENWAIVHRERLAVTYVGVVRQLVALLEERGEQDKALEIARRALTAAPEREEVHYEVVRLYGAQGRSQDALRQFAKLVRFLRREVGMAPSDATRGLVSNIRERTLKRFQRRALARRKPGRNRAAAQVASSSEVSRLPAKSTIFIDRAAELERLQNLLQPDAPNSTRAGSRPGSRLITLTGPDGSGKTRLAVEAAARLSGSYNGNVFYVRLADTDDSAILIPLLADALGLATPNKEVNADSIVAALEGNPALLVLDEWEGMGRGSRDTISGIMEKTMLTCLATSREPVGLKGETVIKVGPLEIPMLPNTPERLLEYPCVQMFADRARNASPEFQVTTRNAHAIASICAALEGMPLAIELAAARANVVTPSQMLTQIATRSDLVAPAHPGIDSRADTVRKAIEWSYDLLPPDLKRFFARLSVFRGGWSLEAAQAICEEQQALEFLDLLVQRSLVTAGEAGNQLRFRMLDALRTFASERLTEQEQSELVERHARYFLNVAERAEAGLHGTDSDLWLEVLESDHENLHAATFARTADFVGLRLAGSIWRFWYLRGYGRAARQWLQTLVDRDASGPPDALARALNGLGALAEHDGDYAEALRVLRKSWKLAREAGDDAGIAETMDHLAALAEEKSADRRSGSSSGKSSGANRKKTDTSDGSSESSDAGQPETQRDTAAAVDARYQESRRIYEELHETASAAAVLKDMGVTSYKRGDLVSARLAYEECLRLSQQMGSRPGIASILHNLGEITHLQGDDGAARELLSKSLAIKRDLGERAGSLVTMQVLSSVARDAGDYMRSAVLLGASEGLRVRLPRPTRQTDEDSIRRTLAALKESMGQTECQSAYDFGKSMTWERALEYAMEPPQPLAMPKTYEQFAQPVVGKKRRSGRPKKVKAQAG